MGWWNSAGDTATRLFSPFGAGASGSAPSWDIGGQLTDAGNWGIGSGDPSNPDRASIRGLGAAQQQFAGQLQGVGQQGMQNYAADRGGLAGTQGYLSGVMQGQNSVSAEQLRQGLQQNQAQQMSLAAGASPQNAAMAARTAAIQSGQLGAGLAGQQALAGIQERNAAAGQLGQLQLGQSGQDLQYGLQGYGLANNAYGGATNAYGQALQNPQKSWGSLMGGGLGGAAGAIASLI